MSNKDKQGVWQAMGMAGSIGLNLVATVAVGLFIGRYADSYFAIAPWCTVFGIVLGMFAGMWSVYKKLIK